MLEQTDSGTPLGRFVYGQSYLKNAQAVPLDPVGLKLSNETYTTVHLKGVFGALRDAGPDYWGRCVIEKHAGKTNLGSLYLGHSPIGKCQAIFAPTWVGRLSDCVGPPTGHAGRPCSFSMFLYICADASTPLTAGISRYCSQLAPQCNRVKIDTPQLAAWKGFGRGVEI